MQGWNDVLTMGPIRIEPATRTALLDPGDTTPRVLRLSRLEFDLLLLLVRARGEPVSRALLLDAVWGQASEVLEHVVEETVSTLRRKLGAGRDLIRTVRGVGYAIAVPQGPCDPRHRTPRGARVAR